MAPARLALRPVNDPISRRLDALDPSQLRWGPGLLRLGAALAVLLGLVAVLAYFFHAPLQQLGTYLVREGGLAGIAVLVLALDPLPGLGFQPGLILGSAAGVSPWPLFAAAAIASWLSSLLGWAVGRYSPTGGVVARFLAFSGATTAVARWGMGAVAIASVTPVPFGLATLGAGAAGMPLRHLALAATTRWLKIGLSLAAITASWSLFG